MPAFSAQVIPCGGAIRLDMPAYLLPASGVTAMMLSRAVSGSAGLGAFTTLYSGAPQPVYIDVGDSSPVPLFAASGYVYQLADNTGTAQLGPVYPTPSLVPQADPLSALLIRLLQAGVNNLALPSGFVAPQITTKMPQGGLAALPFIIVNLDLGQQSATGIGQDIPNPNTGNVWTIWVNAKRVWRISIFCQNSEECDYFTSALISIWQVILATVFDQIGVGLTRDIQFSSGTDVDERKGYSPGFYYADIMFTADGVLNTTVITGYGKIEHITASIEGVGDTNAATPGFEVEVPVALP